MLDTYLPLVAKIFFYAATVDLIYLYSGFKICFSKYGKVFQNDPQLIPFGAQSDQKHGRQRQLVKSLG